MFAYTNLLGLSYFAQYVLQELQVCVRMNIILFSFNRNFGNKVSFQRSSITQS